MGVQLKIQIEIFSIHLFNTSNGQPFPYPCPTPAVIQPPMLSTISLGHSTALSRSRRLCLKLWITWSTSVVNSVTKPTTRYRFFRCSYITSAQQPFYSYAKHVPANLYSVFPQLLKQKKLLNKTIDCKSTNSICSYYVLLGGYNGYLYNNVAR